jgi:hypothetical protein
MSDFLIWIACGFGALLQGYILSLCMPGSKGGTPASEYVATIFFTLLFGPLSLAAATGISVLFLITGFFELVGELVDGIQDDIKERRNRR